MILLPEDVAEIRENYFRVRHNLPPLDEAPPSKPEVDWRERLPRVVEFQHLTTLPIPVEPPKKALDSAPWEFDKMPWEYYVKYSLSVDSAWAACQAPTPEPLPDYDFPVTKCEPSRRNLGGDLGHKVGGAHAVDTDHIRRSSTETKFFAPQSRWLQRWRLPVRIVGPDDLYLDHNEWLVTQPPSWVLDYVAEPKPDLVPYTGKTPSKEIGGVRYYPPKCAYPIYRDAPTILDGFGVYDRFGNRNWGTEWQHAKYLFNVFFRGATREEVLAERENAWLIESIYDPESLRQVSETDEKRLRRRLNAMMSVVDEKKCPSGTCPADRCANPELSYSERQSTHASNLPHMRGKMRGRVGDWYVVVDGHIRWLPDVTKFVGATEEDRVEASFAELVRRDLLSVAREARKAGGNVDEYVARRQAAYDAVAEICQVAAEIDEDAQPTESAAD